MERRLQSQNRRGHRIDKKILWQKKLPVGTSVTLPNVTCAERRLGEVGLTECTKTDYWERRRWQEMMEMGQDNMSRVEQKPHPWESRRLVRKWLLKMVQIGQGPQTASMCSSTFNSQFWTNHLLLPLPHPAHRHCWASFYLRGRLLEDPSRTDLRASQGQYDPRTSRDLSSLSFTKSFFSRHAS